MRAADFRMRSRPQAALELLQEAIGLVSDGPPSAVQAEALVRYGRVFLTAGVGTEGGQPDGIRTGRGNRRSGRRGRACPAQPGRLADHAFIRSDATEALALLERARPPAEACGDGGPSW